MEKHPILVPNGFQIYTKPTEAVANFILGHIENDHHGASFFGGGGLGKTSAQQFLTDHSSRWLVDEHRKPIGVASRLIMPSGSRRSDGAFYTAMTNGLRLTNTDRISPIKGKDRLINFVKTRCGQAEQDLMVMFIDNAQRITRAEFDYLADVDEQLTDAKLRLFLVLFKQSDASGVDVRDDWSEYPSHMLRRWFKYIGDTDELDLYRSPNVQRSNALDRVADRGLLDRALEDILVKGYEQGLDALCSTHLAQPSQMQRWAAPVVEIVGCLGCLQKVRIAWIPAAPLVAEPTGKMRSSRKGQATKGQGVR